MGWRGNQPFPARVHTFLGARLIIRITILQSRVAGWDFAYIPKGMLQVRLGEQIDITPGF